MLVSAFASFSSRPIPPISATFSVREIQHACLPRMSWRTSEKSVRTFCVRKNAKGSGNGNGKLVWIWTKNKEVMTSAVERGWNTFIFGSEDKDLASQWASTATIQPLFVGNGRLYDHENKQVGLFAEISSPSQLEEINKMAGQSENVIIDCLDWQIIPAENVVAAFQDSGTSTFAVTNNVQDAQVFFEALERGMDGVILHTDDVQLIFELKAYFNRRDNLKDVINLNVATVTQVEGMGMGDRVCVDLCSLLFPGEGLLVGSFSKGAFSCPFRVPGISYIASRPFRVNAGPVHAYVAIPDGKTCYLSELESGREIIVVDSTGRQRKAIVGRVKIESRPLILIKAKVESAKCYECSILLQNAETVSLVSSFEGGQAKQLAVPISMLQVGDKVLVSLQECARHTGLPINEFVIER